MFLPRIWIAFGIAGALALIETNLGAQDSRGMLLLVTTDRVATCSVDDAIAGQTPLVARLKRGSHAVRCSARIEGAMVQRKTSVFVMEGQHVRLRLAMLGETSQ